VQAKLRDSATARSAEFDKRCLQFLQKVPFLWFVSLGIQRNEQKTSFELQIEIRIYLTFLFFFSLPKKEPKKASLKKLS